MSAARIRTSAPDPFAGLRGHAYINARGLSRRVQIKGMPSPAEDCQCAPCMQQRLLPAVLQICAAREHHTATNREEPQWNNPLDDAAHELLAASEA